MVTDLGYWTRVLKRLLVTGLTALGIFFAFKLSIFYFPFLIAFIVSIIIEPLIKMVRNHTSLTRRTSAIIVLIVISIILAIILAVGTILLINEASNLLTGLNEHFSTIYGFVENLMNKFSNEIIPKEAQIIIENTTGDLLANLSIWIQNTLGNALNSVGKLPIIATYIGVTLVAIYFICTDKFYILDQIEHHLPKLWVKRMGKHIRELIEILGGYLKAEATLVLISFVIVLIGLYGLRFAGFAIEYPLIMAIFVGFVDALPILGSGVVMIPWAIISATAGDVRLGVAILILWLIISAVRQLLEPKMISRKIGIHPIFTIIAMYTGLRYIGIMGLLVGPIILIIIKNVFATLIDQGVFKTLFDRN